MSRLMIALFITAGLGYAGVTAAQSATPRSAMDPVSVTKDAYAQAKTDADARYKLDKEGCASLSGNAKDICMAEAKGKNAVARAEAAAGYEKSAKARSNVRAAQAQAAYDVSKEKCDDLAGNVKDVCVKEAKAALAKAKADGKVDRVATADRKDSGMKQTDVRKDANADKRDADYQVAIEKCDALAGPAKDACVGNAKAKFGKS